MPKTCKVLHDFPSFFHAVGYRLRRAILVATLCQIALGTIAADVSKKGKLPNGRNYLSADYLKECEAFDIELLWEDFITVTTRQREGTAAGGITLKNMIPAIARCGGPEYRQKLTEFAGSRDNLYTMEEELTPTYQNFRDYVDALLEYGLDDFLKAAGGIQPVALRPLPADYKVPSAILNAPSDLYHAWMDFSRVSSPLIEWEEEWTGQVGLYGCEDWDEQDYAAAFNQYAKAVFDLYLGKAGDGVSVLAPPFLREDCMDPGEVKNVDVSMLLFFGMLSEDMHQEALGLITGDYILKVYADHYDSQSQIPIWNTKSQWVRMAGLDLDILMVGKVLALGNGPTYSRDKELTNLGIFGKQHSLELLLDFSEVSPHYFTGWAPWIGALGGILSRGDCFDEERTPSVLVDGVPFGQEEKDQIIEEIVVYPKEKDFRQRGPEVSITENLRSDAGFVFSKALQAEFGYKAGERAVKELGLGCIRHSEEKLLGATTSPSNAIRKASVEALQRYGHTNLSFVSLPDLELTVSLDGFEGRFLGVEASLRSGPGQTRSSIGWYGLSQGSMTLDRDKVFFSSRPPDSLVLESRPQGNPSQPFFRAEIQYPKNMPVFERVLLEGGSLTVSPILPDFSGPHRSRTLNVSVDYLGPSPDYAEQPGRNPVRAFSKDLSSADTSIRFDWLQTGYYQVMVTGSGLQYSLSEPIHVGPGGTFLSPILEKAINLQVNLGLKLLEETTYWAHILVNAEGEIVDYGHEFLYGAELFRSEHLEPGEYFLFAIPDPSTRIQALLDLYYSDWGTKNLDQRTIEAFSDSSNLHTLHLPLSNAGDSLQEHWLR